MAGRLAAFLVDWTTMLMLIADRVVADGDNVDCVDDNANCVDGNTDLLTMARRSSSPSSLGSLSVQVQPSTFYCALIFLTTLHIFFNILFPNIHFPLLIKLRIDLFSCNPTSRSSLPRTTPPQGG